MKETLHQITKAIAAEQRATLRMWIVYSAVAITVGGLLAICLWLLDVLDLWGAGMVGTVAGSVVGIVLMAVTIHDLPPGMSRTGDGWAVWPFERCKSPECRGRRVTVGFEVSDEDWDAVMGGEKENVVCLTCFDERAQRKGVRYTLIEMHPVGWFDADD